MAQERKNIIGLLLAVGCGFGAWHMYSDKQDDGEPRVITTSTGLRYQVLQDAPKDAMRPDKGDTVSVHYTGWLDEDGQKGRKFDSSVDRGQKFRFLAGAGQVIKGWDETIMDMKVGEKRRIVIPSELAYGEHGAGAVIPGNATLIFEVELFDAEKRS